MASSPSAAQLTEGHRLAQARLAAQTVRLMRSSWPLLDPTDIDGTVGRWLRVTVPLVQRQRRQSILLAGAYLRAFRAVELGMDAGYVPVLDVPDELQAIITSLTVTGPVAIKRAMKRMVALQAATTTAEAASSASAMRHALNGGREVIIRSVEADRRALGWARVVSGKPCPWCLMLASRGPVYREETAGFEAHDNCSCSAEPVYHADAAWPPGAREAQDLWRQAKAEGGDTFANFRRLVAA